MCHILIALYMGLNFQKMDLGLYGRTNLVELRLLDLNLMGKITSFQGQKYMKKMLLLGENYVKNSDFLVKNG